MKYDVIRVLRTPHSERFVLQKNGKDVAAVDLHYLVNGTVAGTLIVFEDSGISEAEMPDIMKFIDEALLPEVKTENDNLFFTAVRGKVIGSYMPESD